MGKKQCFSEIAMFRVAEDDEWTVESHLITYADRYRVARRCIWDLYNRDHEIIKLRNGTINDYAFGPNATKETINRIFKLEYTSLTFSELALLWKRNMESNLGNTLGMGIMAMSTNVGDTFYNVNRLDKYYDLAEGKANSENTLRKINLEVTNTLYNKANFTYLSRISGDLIVDRSSAQVIADRMLKDEAKIVTTEQKRHRL